MTCAMLVLSEVATVYLESGLTAHAFGLDADRDLGLHVARLGVHDRDHGVVLVGDVERAAFGIDGHQLGVGPESSWRVDFELRRCRSRP